MRDDSVGTDTEDTMRHFVVRRDPAERVLLPTEFREHSVEPGGKGR
jgi:hypothetical protein